MNDGPPFGAHVTFRALPGQRAALADLLLGAARRLQATPSCRLYLVSLDAADDTAVTVTELWESKTAHQEALDDPDVHRMIAAVMPLLTRPPSSITLRPLGGKAPI